MPDTSASTGQLSHDSVHLRPRRSRHFGSAPLRNDSVQNKTVRFGSLEPAHVALAKKIVLPLVVVLMLAVCVLACGESMSLQFYALSLVAFLITAQIFTPLDFANREHGGHTRRIVSRALLEWSCAVAILVFLSVAFRLSWN